MKITSVCVIAGIGLFSISQSVVALATVESRTRQPVVRAEEPVIKAEEPIFRSDEPVIRSSANLNSTGDHHSHLNMKQVEAMQQELSEVRGLVETQEHEIQKLKKSQQDLYLDLDKRLNEIKPKSKKSAVQVLPSKSIESPQATSSKESVTSSVEEVMEQSLAEPTIEKPIQASQSSEDTSSSTVAASSHESVKPTSEKELYTSAYNYIRSKQYSEAVTGFLDYLSKYPQGEQAANAHYWLGEVYMAKWQIDKNNRGLLDQATQSFINLKSGFNNHPKVADALLKLGVIETEKNNFVVARQYFNEVKSRYPSTSAARIAASRLQQLP